MGKWILVQRAAVSHNTRYVKSDEKSQIKNNNNYKEREFVMKKIEFKEHNITCVMRYCCSLY